MEWNDTWKMVSNTFAFYPKYVVEIGRDVGNSEKYRTICLEIVHRKISLGKA